MGMFDWLTSPVQAPTNGGGLFGMGPQGGNPDQVNKLQILGAMLQDLGQNYQGKPGGALTGVQQQMKRLGDQQKYQNTIKSMIGQEDFAPVQSTPMITKPGEQAIRQAQGVYNQPSMMFNGPLGQQLGYDQSKAMLPMLQGLDPSQGLPMLASAMQNAQERKDKMGDAAVTRAYDQQRSDINRSQTIQDTAETPLTPEQLQQRGYRPGSVVYRNGLGNESVGQQSDVKSQAAVQQGYDIAQNTPMTAAQRAEVGISRDRLAFEKSKMEAGIPDEATLRDMALRYVHGDKSVATGMSRNAAMQTAFQNMIAQVGREQGMKPEQISQNMQTFSAGAKAVSAFDTGKQGDTVRSLNVSVQHLDTLRELGKALKNGDINLINAARQHFAEAFGGAAPTDWDAAKAIVADEVAKGVIGGQTAQSDRETLAATLKNSRSPEQAEGAINTFQDLLGGQLRGLRQQYKSSTGRDDFNEKLFKETVGRLDPPKQAAANSQGGQGKAPVRILSDADYGRLPSGSTFIAPDGSVRRKP